MANPRFLFPPVIGMTIRELLKCQIQPISYPMGLGLMVQWPSMDRRTVATPVILLLLFLAALAPRLWVLDTYVTADERKWLNRSGNFYLALSHGDWAATFQKAHPGVTVTWLGMLGYLQEFPDFVRVTSEPITDDKLEALLWEDGPVTPLQLLAAGRRWTIFAIALAIAALYFPLRKLYGPPAAAIGALYLAWSPFFLGLSHQLHPDGLLAILSLLALALFMAWIYAGRQWRYLIISSLVLGLALLTKTPAVAVILTGGLLVLVESVRSMAKAEPIHRLVVARSAALGDRGGATLCDALADDVGASD